VTCINHFTLPAQRERLFLISSRDISENIQEHKEGNKNANQSEHNWHERTASGQWNGTGQRNRLAAVRAADATLCRITHFDHFN